VRCRRANRRPGGAVLDKGKSAPVRFLLVRLGLRSELRAVGEPIPVLRQH